MSRQKILHMLVTVILFFCLSYTNIKSVLWLAQLSLPFVTKQIFNTSALTAVVAFVLLAHGHCFRSNRDISSQFQV